MFSKMVLTPDVLLNAYLFQYIVEGEVGCSASEMDEPVCDLDPSMKLGVVLLVVWMRLFQDIIRVLCLQPDAATLYKCGCNNSRHK